MDRTPKNARVRLPDAAIPDVARAVQLHGALGRAEVGGGACFGILVALSSR